MPLEVRVDQGVLEEQGVDRMEQQVVVEEQVIHEVVVEEPAEQVVVEEPAEQVVIENTSLGEVMFGNHVVLEEACLQVGSHS